MAEQEQQELAELTAAVESSRQACEAAEAAEKRALAMQQAGPQYSVVYAEADEIPPTPDYGFWRLIGTTLVAGMLMAFGVGFVGRGRPSSRLPEALPRCKPTPVCPWWAPFLPTIRARSGRGQPPQVARAADADRPGHPTDGRLSRGGHLGHLRDLSINFDAAAYTAAVVRSRLSRSRTISARWCKSVRVLALRE